MRANYLRAAGRNRREVAIAARRLVPALPLRMERLASRWKHCAGARTRSSPEAAWVPEAPALAESTNPHEQAQPQLPVGLCQR